MSRPPSHEELALVARRRFGRLATAGADGAPSVVPVCYALIEDEGEPVVVMAIDEKPKSTGPDKLKRVRNIRENPAVSLVVDEEDEDWSRLAFVQLRGRARVVEPGEEGFDSALASLRAKYVQYQHMDLEQAPQIWIRDLAAYSWSGGGTERPLARSSDLVEVIQGRRSVRAFLPDPVPHDLVRRAIAAAGWAPSPHGRQPWRFAIVERADRRRALADAMASSWRDQLRLDRQPAEVVEIRLAKSRQRLVEAPLLVIPCLYLSDLDMYPDAPRQEAERLMAIQSFGAAVQNFLLTVYAAGLDAGWMCAPLFCPEVVRETLGLDEELTPHALLPVGYAAKDPVRRGRLPVDELIVDWE